MRRAWLILLLATAAAVLHGEWWDESGFDWNSAKKLTGGMVYAGVEKESPRKMRLWAMRVDLHHRKFKFHVTGKAPEYGKPDPTHKNLTIRTRRQTTMDFMKEARNRKIKMAAAFNASPWSPWDNVYSKYACDLGLLISDGELISPVLPGRPSFAVYADGRAVLREFRKDDDLSGVRQAVTGFGWALTDGKARPSGKSLAPRTGYGMSGDRRFLYIVVVDGRQPGYSMGCSVGELGSIMKYFGASSGINMDGGGSSSFVIWDHRGKRPEMLNHQPGNSVRAVGASLGISI